MIICDDYVHLSAKQHKLSGDHKLWIKHIFSSTNTEDYLSLP